MLRKYTVFGHGTDCANRKWFGSRTKYVFGGWVETTSWQHAIRQFNRTRGKWPQIEVLVFRKRAIKNSREVIHWHKNLQARPFKIRKAK